jgi:hypothetical protein
VETFKRNQIEAAIAAVLEPQAAKPSSELLTRLKRLLETDRALGRNPRSKDRAHAQYAFYSADAPGSGVEVWFSAYEAFALLTGLRMMDHGWPQSLAVVVLRHVRAELEQQHGRILLGDAKSPLDRREVRPQATPGALAFENPDPVLLMVASEGWRAGATKGDSGEYVVARGDESDKIAREYVRAGRGWTTFEVARSALLLAKTLAETEPRRRGR